MKKLKDLPIQSKMILIFLVITVPALFLLSSFFIHNDLKMAKIEIVRNLTVLANVVGSNSRAALVFDDEITANTILKSLKMEKPIVSAALYDKNGNVFATYNPDEEIPFQPPTTLEEGHIILKNRIEIVLPIFLQGEKVGKIYIQSHLKEYELRIQRFLLFSGMTLIFILALAVIITMRLQTIITKPILYLAKTTKKLSENADYSIRVKHESDDEIGTLFTGFNEMLAQIEKRESELGVARKILEEKVIECQVAGNELLKNEESTRAILDNAFDAIITMNSNGIITNWNQRATSIFGWHSTEAVGKIVADLIIPSQYRESHRMGLARFLATGEHEILNQQIEISGLHRNGRHFPVEIAVSAIKSGDSYIFTGIIRDITQRKQGEIELIRSRERLRNLSNSLQSAREEEKTRMAREIHDELGQALTALKLDVSWLNKRLSKKDPLIIDKTISMMTLIESTIEVVRKIATELRPQMLDILGLCETFKWLIKEFQTRTGIVCELIIDPDQISIDSERSTALFRIFQETLTNVARHSQATEVHASFKKHENNLTLKIHDNGIGMDEELADKPHSLGLIGMQERVLVLGGKMYLKSSGDEGTTLTVIVPLKT